MNIEDSIEILKNSKKLYLKEKIDSDILEEAIETLLTAYEKEKGENVKLRLQDIPLIEGELKAYKDRVNELKQELEKEKKKNKKARDMIEYYLIENNSLNDFDKRNKELKKIEKVLEE